MNYSISSISIKVFAAIVAFASLSAGSSAQIEQKTVSANVPFKFETASGRQLPAGTYTLHVEQQRLISIRGASAACFASISPEMNRRLAATSQSKLVFAKVNSRYFLREVWIKGQSFHSSLPRGKSEETMERASNNAARPTTFEVATLGSDR